MTVTRSVLLALFLALSLWGAAAGASAIEKKATATRKSLERSFPGAFVFQLQAPYLLVGDITPAALSSYGEHTVRKPVQALQKQFFPNLPSKLIVIYLFRNDASYRYYAKEILGDTPSTPYGYFKGDAMVMNIATGGGTLVHELVHSLMEANFPSAPAWFNEGLGSLYEQCSVEESRLVGHANWRLPALQEALKKGRSIPLERVLSLSTSGFYGEGSGLHYAEARYLCMYLQERGLLESFYRTFLNGFSADPTGRAALETVTGAPVERLEESWKRWVLTLRWS